MRNSKLTFIALKNSKNLNQKIIFLKAVFVTEKKSFIYFKNSAFWYLQQNILNTASDGIIIIY